MVMPGMSLLTGTWRSGAARVAGAAVLFGVVGDAVFAAGFAAGFVAGFCGGVAAGFFVVVAAGFAGVFVAGMLCPACLMESARAAESRFAFVWAAV